MDYAEIKSLRREIRELKAIIDSMKNQQDQMRIDSNRNFKQVFRHLNRIESQPGQHTRVSDGDGPPPNQDHPPEQHARLSRCPKTLHLLWDEWAHGINGNKAAKTFSARERGRVKHLFSKRKVFWDKVSELVRSGDMASSAIDKIYRVYGGGESVTTIMKSMQKDRQIGRAHPLLRV
jgi:hypothetical protein